MKLLFSILIFTLPALAQAAQCENYARQILAVALHQPAVSSLKLEVVQELKVQNVETGTMENVERLTFSYGDGASVAIDTLPSYYKAGVCELSSIKIGRE